MIYFEDCDGYILMKSDTPKLELIKYFINSNLLMRRYMSGNWPYPLSWTNEHLTDFMTRINVDTPEHFFSCLQSGFTLSKEEAVEFKVLFL